MNRDRYRVVFNALRDQLMVVAESARAQGGPASGQRNCLTAALLVAMGGVLLPTGPTLAQIVAYRGAPGNQRPTVLSAGNGVPLVNVQTPSAAGVSRNTYGQFDIQEGGAILNNSRTGAQTQLGGQIAGNPWLAKGTAKVILNEVVSGNPSQLRGAIEVGGDRAEVVVANPAGVEVDGGGFINASRVTVTTGTATINNGSLDGYVVRQGTVTVQGKGLDASQSDYAAIIARAVRVNGAIYAKELKVIAGANRVSADHQQVTPVAGTGPAPAFALDVSALGGMYAGKITLIGTEAGVGVRNAGTIAASAGEVVITADGRLQNSGQIISHADANLDLGGGVGNSGTLYSRGAIRVATRGNIDNSGVIGAQGNASLLATGDASEINSRPGAILIAGLLPEGSLGTSGDLTVTATQRISANGQNRAAGQLEMASPVIGIWGSDTRAPIVRLDAMPSPRRPRTRRVPGLNGILEGEGSIDASGANLVADDSLVAHTAGQLRTDGAHVVAGQIDIQAHDLSNRGGQILDAGARGLNLEVPGEIDNSLGTIASGGAVTIKVAGLHNDGGTVQGGTLDILASGHLGNGGGRLLSAGSARVEAATVDNSGGTLSGSSVSVAADHLINAHGTLQASERLVITSQGTVDNTAGTMASGGLLAVLDPAGAHDPSAKTLAIINTRGTLHADSHLVIDSGSLSFDGTVVSGGDFSAALVGDYTHGAGNDFFQAAGSVALAFTGKVSNDTVWHVDKGLSVSGAQVINGAGGEISSNGVTLVQSTREPLANRGLVRGDTVIVLGAGLDNQAGRITGTRLYADIAGNAVNTGGHVDLAGPAEIHVGGDLLNNAGRIDTGSLDLQVGGSVFSQTQGGLRAGITARSADLTLTVGHDLNLQGADLAAAGHLNGLVFGQVDVAAVPVIRSLQPQTVVRGTGDGPVEGTTTPSPVVADIHAGGDLSLIAGGDANYLGAEIAAGGQLSLGTVTGSLRIHSQEGSAAGPGGIGAGGDISLLSGHDLVLSGLDVHATGGRLLVMAGHDVIAGSAVAAPQGNALAARDGMTIDAGHGNPFGGQVLSDVQASRLAAGLPAGVRVNSVEAGSVSLAGIGLQSGSDGHWTDIAVGAAGDLVMLGTPGGGIGPETAGMPAGQIRGRDVRMVADGGEVRLNGVDILASRDFVGHSGGNAGINGSRLVAGRDLGFDAGGELSIQGLLEHPTTGPASADTYDTPNSTTTRLAAANDLHLTGVRGLTATGVDIQGQELVLVTRGDLSISGGNRHQAWQGGRDDHIRDTAQASTLTGETLTLSAEGQESDIALTHVAIATGGRTRIQATGDISIDPGANYSYDHWTTRHSSGFLVKKTTTTDHVRETLTAVPSTLAVGSLEILGQGDITLTATQIESQGALSIRAGGDIRYLAARNQSYSHDQSQTRRGFLGITFQRKSSRHTERSSTAFVTDIQSQADVLSQSDGRTTLEGTHILSATGRVQLLAGADLDILPAQHSRSVEDVSQSWNLVTGGITPQLNHKIKDTRTQTDVTLAGADITGNTVILVAGGNAHLVGATVQGHRGVSLLAGGTVLVEAGQETHASTHDHQESSITAYTSTVGGRYHGTVVGPIKQTATQSASTAIPLASIIGSSDGDVAITGSQGTAIFGSTVTAHGDIHLGSDRDILVGGSLVQQSGGSSAETSTFVLKVRDGHDDEWQSGTVQPGSLNAGGRVIFAAPEGSVTLGAVNIGSGGAIEFQTPELQFVTEKNTDYRSHTAWDRDRGYEINRGSGHLDETLSLAHLDAQGGLMLPAGTRVSVDLDGHLANATQPSAADLRHLALGLSAQPELAWLKTLADRPDVDWQAIRTAHQHWDYKHQGLTQAGAIVLTVVVSYFTAGWGAEWLNAAGGAGTGTVVTTTAAGTTVTTTVAGCVANAAVSSLFSQAAVSFANNGGDLGKTLHDLGSSATVRNIVSSMLVAGIANAPVFEGGASLNDIAGIKSIPGLGSSATFDWDRFTWNLWGMAGRGVVTAGVNRMVYGGDGRMGDSFMQSFVGDLSAMGASYIGTTWGGGRDPLMQTVAHAGLGCAAASAVGKDCTAGAIGGLSESVLGNVVDHFGGLPVTQSGYTTATQALYTGGALVFADILADAADRDIGTAMGAAQNAAVNNYLSNWQQALKDKELRSCASLLDCSKVRFKWALIDKQQDLGLVIGVGGGIGLGAYQMAEGIVDLIVHWDQTAQVLKAIINDPNVRAAVGEQVLKDYQQRIDTQTRAYEDAGWDGSITAGVEAGRLALEVVTLAQGIGSAGKLVAELPAAGRGIAQAIVGKGDLGLLVKYGGVIGADGKPLMNFRNLSVAEKEQIAAILGKEMIQAIGDDAQAIGRVPLPGQSGIDQIFKVGDRYVIVEYKFGQSRLGSTLDDLQMSDTWIFGKNTGYDRVLEAVGESAAMSIEAAYKAGKLEKWLVNVDPFGGVRGVKLDALAKPIPGTNPFAMARP
jgi:filamentous hemagglutinin family protein